jgi:hypothetical protein
VGHLLRLALAKLTMHNIKIHATQKQFKVLTLIKTNSFHIIASMIKNFNFTKARFTNFIYRYEKKKNINFI